MTSIAHIAVTCKDMAESLRFYTEALGGTQAFEIARPGTGKPWIIYMALDGGQFVELFYDGARDNPWSEDLVGFNHLCLAVDDIHAATQRVLDAGYKMDAMPSQGEDKNWQSWTMDPNGIRVELMQIDPESPQAQYLKKGMA